VRSLVLYFPIFVLIAVLGSAMITIVVFGALPVFGGFNIAFITRSIHSAERAERGPL
jgi:hypothetical protein